MRKSLKYGIFGFLFGTLGLYIIAMLSLLSPVFEILAVPVMFPGKYVASTYAGPDGSSMEVFMLTIFNGVVFGILFALFALVFRGRK